MNPNLIVLPFYDEEEKLKIHFQSVKNLFQGSPQSECN